MGLLSDRPVLIGVVAVEVPAPDCLDSPRRAYQRLEVSAILAGHLIRRFQQFFNPPQNGIFGFVEDVIPFSGQLLHPVHPLPCFIEAMITHVEAFVNPHFVTPKHFFLTVVFRCGIIHK